MNIKIIVILFSLVGICNGATILTFSGKGYINQNKTFVLSSETGYTSWTSNGFYNNTTKSQITFGFDKPSTPTTNSSWWDVTFAAPSGQQLVAGMDYLGAVRYPFAQNNQPSLDLSGDGRGSNQLSGWFKILELTWTPDNKVATAAVDFLQLSENNPDSWTLGSLRWNSNIPVSPVPEPSTSILSLLSLAFVVRRKR